MNEANESGSLLNHPKRPDRLPLLQGNLILSVGMDHLVTEMVRMLSLADDGNVRRELHSCITTILTLNRQKRDKTPETETIGSVLLDGECRVLTEMLEVMATEETAHGREIIYQVLVTLLGNGWRRREVS